MVRFQSIYCNPASDGHISKEKCILKTECDIIGIAETHLINNETMNIDGFTWVGQNRASLHKNARTGSGGVGLLVRSSLNLKCSVLDDATEGILWVSLNQGNNIAFNVCICYLPPEYSSRAVDAQSFYEQLLTHVYTYQDMGDFIIMGDFNSRCGDQEDFIEGVDSVPVRNIIDTFNDGHGVHMINFLLSASCCMLNGRAGTPNDNDFTSFNHRGQSVVDYCFVPN